tara:strand:- start:2116 stop:2421 length:306 start_codon:yes stop_codon:yes gene_type:complete
LSERIDVSSNFNLQAKKFDYIRIAFILQNFGELTSNQITYYYTNIFPDKYTSCWRITQLLKQRKSMFQITKQKTPKLYVFQGEIILNKHTKRRWNEKLNKF